MAGITYVIKGFEREQFICHVCNTRQHDNLFHICRNCGGELKECLPGKKKKANKPGRNSGE